MTEDKRQKPRFSSTEQREDKTAHIRKRKRKKSSHKKILPEPDWEREDKTSSASQYNGTLKWGVAGLLLIVLLFTGGLVGRNMFSRSSEIGFDNTLFLSPEQQQVEEDDVSQFISDADPLARAFVSGIDEEKRLTLVRDAETVRGHLDRYPEDARTFSIKNMKLMGYSEMDGRRKCAYAVQLTNGNARLLTVIETEAGLKVDWDSYARYCSASWQDLCSGKVTEAEVRVYVKSGDHTAKPFDNVEQWTCFLLAEADSDRVFYGYAPKGSELAQQMLAAIMKNRSSRQHMTLKISSDGKSCKERLFVVDELLAMGWVRE